MKNISILTFAFLSMMMISSCGGGGATGPTYNNDGGGDTGGGSNNGGGNNGGGNNGGGNNGGGTTPPTNISVTVSAGKYVINGVTTGNISLEKGMTYTFTNSSGSAHPFRLSTAMDGTHGGGSTYGTGVSYNGSVLTFVVPATAPSTMYYFCTVHQGMGGSGRISITGASGSNTTGGSY